ncbi:hypothetical protein [Mesoterricola sediminis]|uniref:hypothetical protein n=1 Tax=Mesoterricola sediminis TaxID=2927980 RepID=UPI00292F69A8|nr:hypothetical protein [Mesoterricola sediminis]
MQIGRIFAAILFALSLAAQDDFAPPPPTLPPKSAQDARSAGMVTQQDVQFWRALTNTSTAPSFVVADVCLPSGRRMICIEAPFLLYAIQIEKRLPATEKGRREAFEIAISQHHQGYIFKNPKAIKNLPIRYNEAELKWVEDIVCKYSAKQILENVRDRRLHPIESLIQGAPKTKGDYRIALAHSLYTKGICVGRGCVNSSLWVAE